MPERTHETFLAAVEFDALLADQRGRLYGIAAAILLNQADAEDALQTAFLKAWRARASLRDQGEAAAWLTRICVNQCLDHRRALRRRPTEPLDERRLSIGPAVDPASLLDLDRAFATLSRRQRTALILHNRFGYSIEECAATMGCSSGSVRTHLARAMASLRKEMQR